MPSPFRTARPTTAILGAPRNRWIVLGFLVPACAPPPGDAAENIEDVPIYVDYEVADYDAVRERALNDPDVELVVELVDFGKTDFGALEEPYDTTVVEQDGLRVALDRATNVIAFTGEGFSASFDLEAWVAAMVPTYGEGWCVPDPVTICSEQWSYLPESDMHVVAPFAGGAVDLQLLLVQGPWTRSTQTFAFGRLYGVVGVHRDG